MFKIHSPQSNCSMNTDYQRNKKFWIFVNSEQHSTKTHQSNSGPILITWSAIGSWISFSATSVTCDIFTFKNHSSNFHHEQLLHDSLQEIYFHRMSGEITMFRRAFQGFLSWIEHSQFTPPLPNLCNIDFCISIISLQGSTVTTMTWI